MVRGEMDSFVRRVGEGGSSGRGERSRVRTGEEPTVDSSGEGEMRPCELEGNRRSWDSHRSESSADADTDTDADVDEEPVGVCVSCAS